LFHVGNIIQPVGSKTSLLGPNFWSKNLIFRGPKPIFWEPESNSSSNSVNFLLIVSVKEGKNVGNSFHCTTTRPCGLKSAIFVLQRFIQDTEFSLFEMIARYFGFVAVNVTKHSNESAIPERLHGQKRFESQEEKSSLWILR